MMPSFFSKLLGAFGQRNEPDDSESPLDYDAMIILDAEELAEQGMGSAYQEVIPALQEYVEHVAEFEEVIDVEKPSYSVRCGGVEHLVYSADVPGSEEDSWGRATYIFFQMVNAQLDGAKVRFYAINGGNDLGGMFLTPAEAAAAQAALPRKSDWPYIPGPDGSPA